MTIQEDFIGYNPRKEDWSSRISLISGVMKKLSLLLAIILGNFTAKYCSAENYVDDARRGLSLSFTNNFQKDKEATLHRLPAPPPDNRPNIILIVLDDWRFDSYSCNGAPYFIQTPSIDRI